MEKKPTQKPKPNSKSLSVLVRLCSSLSLKAFTQLCKLAMSLYITPLSSSSASSRLPNNKPSNFQEPQPVVLSRNKSIPQPEYTLSTLLQPASHVRLSYPHSHTSCKAKPQQQRYSADTPDITLGFRFTLLLHKYKSTDSQYAES